MELKKKKTILILLFCIIYILNLSDYAFAMDRKVLKIAGDNNYPPYEFIDEHGNYRGFNVDMMRAMALELGIEIEFKPMGWQEAMDALENGEVDIVQGMTRSDIREEKFDFSTPLVTNSQAIFVLKDTNYISSLENLSNKKASFQLGDISYELARDVENIKSYVRINQEEAIDLLLDGKVDAFVGNRLTGIYYLQKEGNFDKVKIVGEPMHITEYCTTVKKGNEEILNLVNEGLNGVKKSDNYDKIYKKWFGETFTDHSKEFKKLLYITLLFLLIISIIAIVNVYWNGKLKREVNNRTLELGILNKELVAQKIKFEKSNQLRGKILESILSGIIVFDENGDIIEYNKAAEEILGRELFLQHNWNTIALDSEYGFEGYTDAEEGRAITKSQKISMNNRESYINYSFIPIGSLNEGVILLLNDFTAIKKYQDMASYNDKMQALGELSAGIAHEIRNPLTSINTFIDLIPTKIDDEQFREQLVAISKKEIHRMNELITQLIDYTKPVSGKPQVFSLSEALDESLILFSNQFSKKGIMIETNIEDVVVFADKSQIKQILVNIILNSIEAVEESGEIHINILEKGNKGVIEIIDNGCGIEEEYKAKIFQPFFTLKPHGTGIGLAVTSKLVEENKGKLIIDSQLGKGTKVTVALPIPQ